MHIKSVIDNELVVFDNIFLITTNINNIPPYIPKTESAIDIWMVIINNFILIYVTQVSYLTLLLAFIFAFVFLFKDVHIT